MAWIAYRKVFEPDCNFNFDWLGFTPPIFKNNKRWPFIISDDGTQCRHANLFLLNEPIFKGFTEDTLQTYAESLVSFLSCLENNEIDWKEVTKYDLLMYRESMRTPSSVSNPLEPRTINLRLTVVDAFYNWARRRYPSIALFNTAAENGNNNSNKHGSRIERLFTPRLKVYDTYSLAPTSLDALDFIASLPDPYDLMAKWQLITGLRSSGIRNLSLNQIKNARPCNKSVYRILIKEKLYKPRYIYPPKFLIDETKSYIKSVRKSNRQKSLLPPLNINRQEVIFISEKSSPITEHSYYYNFRRSSILHGSKIKSHMLRSSFATNMLAILRSLEKDGLQINSLLVVRELLGHSWMSTTEKYIKNVDVEVAISTAFKDAKDIYFFELANNQLLTDEEIICLNKI